MALPKLQAPIFELVLPSTGKKVKFRQFLVKEEKILLVAKQSDDPSASLLAFKQIVSNCILDSIDVDALPLFDLEYIFLMIRSKSQNNIVEFKITEEGAEYDARVDLNEIHVNKNPDHSSKIDLDGTVGVVMKYPSLEMLESLNLLEKSDLEEKDIMKLIESCIDKVYDADSVYLMNEASEDEKKDFFDSLDTSYLIKLQKFFETFPSISITMKYKKDGKILEKELKGLSNFLA